ncbi:MAG: type II toxin-antitoxin system RelE/ParE family toxin [Gammaproteobacteria bacterium]|nr:type II toxin-antitoxin system RelE/ParE family toxin [Gammaproteobacteria bacterium]
MKIAILPAANEDLINGYHFYEQQQSGVGDYFLDSLFADIDSLIIYHGVHSLLFNRYYRMLAKRFPFAIYYTIEDETIVIYAVLDNRRDPAWIEGRLEP